MSGSPSGLIPRTNNSSLGLGAVGGPRGFSAGVTQVLVNFLLQYSKGNVDQLKKDMASVQAATSLNNQRTQAYQDRAVALQKQLAQGELARLKLGASGNAVYKDLVALQQKANLEVTAYGRVTKGTTADLLAQEQLVKTTLGLTTEEGNALRAVADRQAQLVADQNALNAAKRQGNALTLEQGTIQKAQQFAQAGLNRIGSLGIGLIGGTIGGLITSGLILGPLQAALDGATQSLEKILDPAKAAGDALKDVASALADIQKSSNLSNLGSATQLLKNLSLPTTFAGQLTGAIDLQAEKENLDTAQKVLDYIQGASQLSGQLTAQRASEAAQADRLAGSLKEVGLAERFSGDQAAAAYAQSSGFQQFIYGLIPGSAALARALDGTDWAGYSEGAAGASDKLKQTAEAAKAAADYIAQLNQQHIDISVDEINKVQIGNANAALDTFTQHANDVAAAQVNTINTTYDAAIRQIQSGDDAAVAALQKKMQALQLQPSARTKALESQLNALKDAGPSKRTNELADAIDKLNAAQAKAQYQAQLANIDEQRHQILLAQRLAQTKQQINLEDYQGQDRITAIDALLTRMQKQNAAQDTFNKLLDIQYNITQGVKRQQGETIQDFINRRAQYYRSQLQQAADLRKQGPIADLQAEKAKLQTTLQLKDLEAQRKKVIEDKIRADHLKSLQDQLSASKAHDQAELQSRRDALQKELDASKKADQARLDSAKQALQNEIDQVRKAAADRIDALNNARDKNITAAEAVRDASIKAARNVTDQLITQLQARADQTKQWTNVANIEALNQAIQGATSMAQLQQLAGSLAGLSWTMNYLRQTGAFMGLDPNAQAALLGSYTQAIQSYVHAVSGFYRQVPAPNGPGKDIGHFAQGGVWIANNANTPVGRDIRWGDGNGEELGVMLNNKVMHTLREQGGPGSRALVGGDMNIQTGEDPYRARAAWRRELRGMIREEIQH